MDDMLGLWKFHWDCGRNGCIDSLFKATQQEVESAIGKQVYFGEVLGKHSEIYGGLESEDVSLVSTDQHVVDAVPAIGLNPLTHIRYVCVKCDCEYTVDDMNDDKTVCVYCSHSD